MIHWLTVFVYSLDLCRKMSTCGVSRGRGGFGMKASNVLCDGALYFFNPDTDEAGVLVLNGDFCDRHQNDLPYYASLGRVSRIDIANDDFPYTPREFRYLHQSGRVISKMRNARFIEGFGDGDGNTFYLGSRTSDRYCRIYDRRGVNRVEVECKGEVAHQLGYLLATCNAIDWKGAITSCFRITNGDATRGHRAADDPLYDTWRSDTRPLSVSRERRQTKLERVMHWVRSSVAPTLAALRDVLDEHDFALLLRADVDPAKVAAMSRWAESDEPATLAGSPSAPPEIQGCFAWQSNTQSQPYMGCLS